MSISLNTITISNFKTFKGETVIGPIQSFTAIIGPNGSGKSNIMDAVRFVLGEKSSALRVKRLNELIYGYPEELSAYGATYVKIIFVIDDIEEKNFTRTIHDEISQYKMDDKIVTSVIYMAELQKMNLDIKAGNFLIPQGYIESYALKTPKELTEMFEEISNSNAYKADYDRLKLKLLKAEEEIHFAHQMKKLTLFTKKNATMEKEETEKYLQLKKQYKKKKLKFQSIRLLLIKKEIESLEDEERKIKLQVDECLHDKEAAIHLLENTKLQFKSLFNTIENIEQDILKMEDIIQKSKIKYVTLEENILYWQKKRDCARVSLDNANKAHDIRKKIIQELKNELKQIDNKLAELRKASQMSTIELSNFQVKRYMELMIETECRAKDSIKEINNLMRDKQADHDKLDNKNRCKHELEDKVKRIKLSKEDLETRLKKLQNLDAEFKATLMDKKARIQELGQKIIETENKLLNLENDIAKISEELSEAAIDHDTVSQEVKKNNIIKMLKQFHSGIYGRISDLCKPIHPRYNVAITKVFGKNMDAIIVDMQQTAIQCIQFLKEQKIGVERFLPLDSIKTVYLNESLRAIKDPIHVKLLYDVLEISSVFIKKAVLFITQNILVCETAEDAETMAYKTDENKTYSCVSLDGCFYHKDGTISGGQTDLIVKAKQWEKQQIFALKERKAQLIQELRNLPKIFVMQSELDTLNIEIEGLTLRNNYIEIDIKDTENKIVRIHEELDALDRELLGLNMTISKIQNNIQQKDETVKNIEKFIKTIKDEIFVDFCKDINIPDISYYEKNNLRTYQERKNKQLELEKQYDHIENQLRFENENDTESKILKWKHFLEQAETEWNKAYQQECHEKMKIKQAKSKMSVLKDSYAKEKNNIENVEKKLAQYKLQIDVIGKLYLDNQKAHIAIRSKIEQKQIECNTILNECKIEDIVIPKLQTSHRPENEDIFTYSSSLSTDSEISMKIDFSRFPQDIRNCVEEDMTKQLSEELIKIQTELNNILKPNLNIDEKIDSITDQMQEININLRNCRKKSDEIRTQFELVKAKRYKLFSDYLEQVAAEIDSTYKNLVHDMSAQAIIFSDNLEEPYIGNIIYNCIVPSKGFLPLQYLSGGEKSLASLALFFAMQRDKQIPFLIMDEIDAALDKTNIKNVIRFIQSQLNTTQLITISLRRQLYSNADVLIGVTLIPDEKHSNSNVFAISLNGYK